MRRENILVIGRTFKNVSFDFLPKYHEHLKNVLQKQYLFLYLYTSFGNLTLQKENFNKKAYARSYTDQFTHMANDERTDFCNPLIHLTIKATTRTFTAGRRLFLFMRILLKQHRI